MSLSKLYNLLDEAKREAASLEAIKLKKDPISLDALGEYLRSYRKEHGISQEYFAEIVGVSKNVIVNIEKSRHSVTLQNLLKVTDNLGLKLCLI